MVAGARSASSSSFFSRSNASVRYWIPLWLLGMLAALILALCCCAYFAWPVLCFCHQQEPENLDYNPYFDMYMPANMHEHFRAVAELDAREPVVRDSPLADQLQERSESMRQRHANSGYPQTPFYLN